MSLPPLERPFSDVLERVEELTGQPKMMWEAQLRGAQQWASRRKRDGGVVLAGRAWTDAEIAIGPIHLFIMVLFSYVGETPPALLLDAVPERVKKLDQDPDVNNVSAVQRWLEDVRDIVTAFVPARLN